MHIETVGGWVGGERERASISSTSAYTHCDALLDINVETRPPDSFTAPPGGVICVRGIQCAQTSYTWTHIQGF